MGAVPRRARSRRCLGGLSLVIQVLLDSAVLSSKLKWVARIAAPLTAIALSGAFLALRTTPTLQHYSLQTTCLVIVVLLTGIGLLRKPSVAAQCGKGRIPGPL
jgi:hypothetical protein